MKRFLVFLAFGLPTAAMAQTYECQFVTECFDTESCADTAYDLTYSIEGSNVNGSDVVGDFVATSLPGDGFLIAEIGKPFAMLTLSETTARYSIHDLLGDYAITYFGQCEVSQ